MKSRLYRLYIENPRRTIEVLYSKIKAVYGYNLDKGYGTRSVPTTFSLPNQHLARRRELACLQGIEI